MTEVPKPFPTSLDEFSADERVYQTLDPKEWHLEDENGLDWEFIPNIKEPKEGTWRQAVRSCAVSFPIAHLAFRQTRTRTLAMQQSSKSNSIAPRTKLLLLLVMRRSARPTKLKKYVE